MRNRKGRMGPAPMSLEVRFQRHVSPNPETGCWVWTGGLYDAQHGYGNFGVKRDDGKWRAERAHRVAWELYRGPIPQGTEIDHLCRNPICVNPDHLQPVPHLVNLERGNSPPQINRRKTHCIRGHEFTPENTAWVTSPAGNPARYCRTCIREYKRNWMRKHRK